MTVYRRHHIRKLTQMVAKAIGADPQGALTRLASSLIWRLLALRAGLTARKAEAVG